MDDHINQLNQAKNILSSILGTALQSLDNKHVVQEAKSHIRQAISTPSYPAGTYLTIVSRAYNAKHIAIIASS